MCIGLLYCVELAVGQAYEYYIPLVLEPLPVVSSPSVNQQAYLSEPEAAGEGRSVRQEILINGLDIDEKNLYLCFK